MDLNCMFKHHLYPIASCHPPFLLLCCEFFNTRKSSMFMVMPGFTPHLFWTSELFVVMSSWLESPNLPVCFHFLYFLEVSNVCITGSSCKNHESLLANFSTQIFHQDWEVPGEIVFRCQMQTKVPLYHVSWIGTAVKIVPSWHPILAVILSLKFTPTSQYYTDRKPSKWQVFMDCCGSIFDIQQSDKLK